jgi:hypothetical protein
MFLEKLRGPVPSFGGFGTGGAFARREGRVRAL